jgi:hypothetical protein
MALGRWIEDLGAALADVIQTLGGVGIMLVRGSLGWAPVTAWCCGSRANFPSVSKGRRGDGSRPTGEGSWRSL